MDAKKIRAAVKRRLLCSLVTGFATVLMLALTVSARADVREAVKRALPATVGVEWRDSADKASNQVKMASGTIVSENGLVVTMIDTRESRGYRVTLGDGRVVDGQLVVDDRRTGLKLVKIDAAKLPFLTLFAPLADLGEEVVATYCLDLKERAVARGIVASRDRELKPFGTGLLQLDVDAGIMSAGAPLVDDQGRLRGIIAFRRVGRSTGTSFAWPAARVQVLLDERPSSSPKVIQHGWFGIRLKESDEANGHVVAHPLNDSPALAAGMRDGDWILAIDGAAVHSQKELLELLNRRAAGQTARLKILRDGKEREIDVPLVGMTEPVKDAAPTKYLTAPAPAWNVVRPDQVFLAEKDGAIRVLNIAPGTNLGLVIDNPGRLGVQLQSSKPEYGIEVHRANDATPSVPAIQVERSDMEKRIEQFGRDCESLRKQMETLTEEVRRLSKQLSEAAPNRK